MVEGQLKSSLETGKVEFPCFAAFAYGQCTGSATYYEILDLINVNQSEHGFTTVNDVSI